MVGRNQEAGGGVLPWGGHVSDHRGHRDQRQQHPGDGRRALQRRAEGAAVCQREAQRRRNKLKENLLLKVTDAVVLMDREQGGVEMLASRGIRLLPVISMFKLLDVLLAAGRIDGPTAQSVRRFIQDNNTFRSVCSQVNAAAGQHSEVTSVFLF